MKLRNLLYIVATVLLVGCSEKYDESSGWTPTLTPRYLSVSPTSLTYTYSSESKNIDVTSTQTSWIIENAIDWVSISPLSGSTSSSVSVNVSENKSGDDARVGLFYLKSNMNDWNYEAPISITQAGAQPVITLSKHEVEFTGASNSETISVTSNCSWTATSESSWLSVTISDNGIILTATSNETNDYRSTTVYVSHIGNINTSENITIRQAPASITASTEAIEFKNSASKVDVTIKSEANWTATTTSSWIEVAPQSGSAGTSSMTINVSENTSTSNRTGYVILTIGNQERIQIPIKQDGIYINVNVTSFDFKASGETKSIKVNSNTNWEFKNCPSWISISKSSGKGDAEVTITAQDNPSTNLRSGKLQITQDGIDVGEVISITQQGKTLTVSPQLLSFGDSPSSSYFVIEADDTWKIINDNSWISVTPSSGKGKATITVSVAENESEGSRQGNITVSMLDKALNVSVSQTGKVFSVEVDNTKLTFPASGGEVKFNIASNTYWTLSDYPSWLTLSKTSGNKNAEITATASENPNVTERTGTILLGIDGKEGKSTINVTQQGKYFELNPTSLAFTSVQGSQSVAIKTDGAWSASTEAAWITLSTSSGSGNSNLTITVSENNTNSERNSFVTVKMGDKSLSVPVSQEGKYLTIENTLLTCTSKGGTFAITISTNDSWSASISGDASWLSLSQSKGSGTTEIKVSASDNPSVNKRKGSIMISTPHDQSVEIVVTQDARYLKIDTHEILFYAKGGTSESITISTDGTFKIECADSWLSINQTDKLFTVTATENTGNEARVGKITVSLTDLKEGSYSLSLTVTQLNVGGSFLVIGYGDDINYDNNNNCATTNLTISAYGADNNYDSTITNGSGTTLSISNYKSDSNWDTNYSSNVTVTITGYKPDDNLDPSTTTSGTITKTGYGDDSNWQ